MKQQINNKFMYAGLLKNVSTINYMIEIKEN
jgi:hypothetical protein